VISPNGHAPVTLAHVHKAFGRWLAFPADEADRPRYDFIDIALAVIVANRMEADPLWLFLVAPPSSGKTEVLRALDEVPDIFRLSTLTAQTFASGFEKRGAETSLLPKISGKTLVMKDFTTVLTLHREARAEILAQLREIYDGSFRKEWGNGKTLDWRGKVGLLAGVTGVLDREYAVCSILGERFLSYRVPSATRRALAGRAIAQGKTWEQDQRNELCRIVASYVDTLLPVAKPVPEPIIDGLAALADFTARARSPVIFNQRGDIELLPGIEGPGRLAKQLYLLAQALAIVRDEPSVGLVTYATVVQVAHDTLPGPRQVTLAAVLDRADQAGQEISTTQVAVATNYPTSTARRYMQELAGVGLVDREAGEPGRADKWKPSEELLSLRRDIQGPVRDLSSSVRESVISE
jgi:hypothetical protein